VPISQLTLVQSVFGKFKGLATNITITIIAQSQNSKKCTLNGQTCHKVGVEQDQTAHLDWMDA
jgi:hypothetical protein